MDCVNCMFHNECLSKEMCIYDMAHDLIENDDSMPVVHGHWDFGRCSKCNGHAPYWSMASTCYESDYCPHCGAKMDRKW